MQIPPLHVCFELYLLVGRTGERVKYGNTIVASPTCNTLRKGATLGDRLVAS